MYVFSFFAESAEFGESAEFADWARNLAKFLPLVLPKQLKYYFRESKNKYLPAWTSEL